MIEEFTKYVSDYDLENKYIKLKYDHSIRVMELGLKYSKLLNFDANEIELAKMIGLLHDIGRFEQLKIYNSFRDYQTIDHADYGVKILFDDNEIIKYTKNKEDYDLIAFAIKNHNKYKIDNNQNESYMKQAMLIRDIDKIDILYLSGYLNEINLVSNDEDISVEIMNSIINHKTISYKDIKNSNDRICVYFAYAFDIYNDACLEEFKQNLEYIYNRLNNKKFEKIKNIVFKYIDERIDNYVRNKI